MSAPIPLSAEQKKQLVDWLDDGYLRMDDDKRGEFLSSLSAERTLLPLFPPSVAILAGYHALGVQDFPGVHGDEIVAITTEWMRKKFEEPR